MLPPVRLILSRPVSFNRPIGIAVNLTETAIAGASAPRSSVLPNDALALRAACPYGGA
jgi:hypothetical protein